VEQSGKARLSNCAHAAAFCHRIPRPVALFYRDRLRNELSIWSPFDRQLAASFSRLAAGGQQKGE
jgi:hypothetical protein